MAFGGTRTLAWINSRSGAATSAPTVHHRPRMSLPSPWQQGSLTQIAYADVFGAMPMMTREQAMTIPGVARGRGIILSLIADKPLKARGGAVESSGTQPAWLYRTPGAEGPWTRMSKTLDDHIFYGVSVWACIRGAATAGLRPILSAWHMPYDEWDVDPDTDTVLFIDDDGHWYAPDEDEYIVIPSASEGLCAMATRTLIGAVELEKAWTRRATNPIPMVDLHETVQSNMTPDEAQEVVDMWAAARGDVNGAIAYTPYNIEARALGQYSPDMFIEARNSSRLDLAGFLQIPGSLLDASTATASLTYVTQEGQASSLDTLTVPYWARPVEDRLGQDDIVPIGQSVNFDWLAAYTEPPMPVVTSAAGHPVIESAVEQLTSEQLDTATEGTPANV